MPAPYSVDLRARAIAAYKNGEGDQASLERGKFRVSLGGSRGLGVTHRQLSWLLAGLDFQLMHEFNELNYSHYY